VTIPGFRPSGHHLSRLTLAFVVMLGVVTSSPLFAQAKPKAPPVEQALITLENAWNDALVKSDVVALGRMLAEDYTFTDLDGTMLTKAQELGMLKSGEDVITSAVSTNMKVRVYVNAAVVTGHITLKEKLKGKDVSGSYAFTDTWVNKSGTWECVATHSSRLAQK